ncbi:protein of unknown function [Candidatus Filomicrobium marinum]|nr:protein of unknown function [Candidatus Filomicrobium marinum]
MVPPRMARNVAPSTKALAAGNSLICRWSGRMPYLIGPKSAAMLPNRKSAENNTGIDQRAISGSVLPLITKPTAARTAIGNSASLMATATLALSYLSASSPPKAERKKNGTTSTAPANVTSEAPESAPILKSTRITSAFLMKLSFSADRNWHQNKGAKRREVMRSLNIFSVLSGNERGCNAPREADAEDSFALEHVERTAPNGHRPDPLLSSVLTAIAARVHVPPAQDLLR